MARRYVPGEIGGKINDSPVFVLDSCAALSYFMGLRTPQATMCGVTGCLVFGGKTCLPGCSLSHTDLLPTPVISPMIPDGLIRCPLSSAAESQASLRKSSACCMDCTVSYRKIRPQQKTVLAQETRSSCLAVVNYEPRWTQGLWVGLLLRRCEFLGVPMPPQGKHMTILKKSGVGVSTVVAPT